MMRIKIDVFLLQIVFSHLVKNEEDMGKGKFDQIGSTRITLQWFSLMVLSSQIVGVLAIILLAILFGQYRGGFGWTVSKLQISM